MDYVVVEPRVVSDFCSRGRGDAVPNRPRGSINTVTVVVVADLMGEVVVSFDPLPRWGRKLLVAALCNLMDGVAVLGQLGVADTNILLHLALPSLESMISGRLLLGIGGRA